ncbi:MAG: hypothetical protein NKF70_00185 [Methanobacterium sp. ERen5]|nr:MAG: hypothetical protein NKF70_00185 [Methanobacterium sp. ERen5]
MTNELTQIINQENLRVCQLFSLPDEPEDEELCDFCGTPIPVGSVRCLKCGRMVR